MTVKKLSPGHTSATPLNFLSANESSRQRVGASLPIPLRMQNEKFSLASTRAARMRPSARRSFGMHAGGAGFGASATTGFGAGGSVAALFEVGGVGAVDGV